MRYKRPSILQNFFGNNLKQDCYNFKVNVGNFMRYMDDRTTVSQKRLFDEYSKKWEKLAKSSFQTILENNRTQGVIEQHFRDLKQNRLRGKRLARLDDFVTQYHHFVSSVQKEFSDIVYRNKPQGKTAVLDPNYDSTGKQCSKVVQSTFKKRKRNVNSYYASLWWWMWWIVWRPGDSAT